MYFFFSFLFYNWGKQPPHSELKNLTSSVLESTRWFSKHKGSRMFPLKFLVSKEIDFFAIIFQFFSFLPAFFSAFGQLACQPLTATEACHTSFCSHCLSLAAHSSVGSDHNFILCEESLVKGLNRGSILYSPYYLLLYNYHCQGTITIHLLNLQTMGCIQSTEAIHLSCGVTWENAWHGQWVWCWINHQWLFFLIFLCGPRHLQEKGQLEINFN